MSTRRQRIRRALLALFFLALPITLNYYSPYLMLTGSAEGVASFSLVFWLAVFATSLVGRSFCGTHACPMQLPVADMVRAGNMRTTECFMCETCVDVCPRAAIEVGFGQAV